MKEALSKRYLFKRSKEEGIFSEAKALEKLALPRKEYASGEVKLDFHHRFSTGESFSATEDEEGEAKINIAKEGKILVDFNKYAQALGYRFVTPTYAKKNNLEKKLKKEGMTGRWAAEGQETADSNAQLMILLGDMREPKHIFALLHELGHVANRFDQQKFIQSLPKSRTRAEKFAILESKSERTANANMMKTARDIRGKFGLDLFEIFKDAEDFRKFYTVQLACARYSQEWRKHGDEVKTGTKALWVALTGSNPSKEAMGYYGNLFDKSKFSKEKKVLDLNIKNKLEEDKAALKAVRSELASLKVDLGDYSIK